ncbi:hypothetical protein EJ05DRAFT_503001 [Pseudovirgaria hyperparasitica]|uniref:Mediator of RNA polymerase II transcription subunit 6 n=1 Tax=Pseudovirgaria hyperparasitica TaxID=470096 RepID=A0A6A6W0D3_9PEZI|nr:uncharacterized protein EJ05DRAFT_503001 [Pseudovirgaria hyperparasitica]KAF2755546.1 hypothetical protein EJ05DRAFT_503001 [Pseudovirgaria hyperparasitica]
MAQSLDEIVWEAPQFFMSGDPFWLNLHPNNIHFYFHESPFFDRMSNNSAIETQAKVDPTKNYLLADRKLFEQAVKDMPSGGLEFIIVSEPQQLANGSSNDTWIMQKQHRSKTHNEPDDVTVMGQWLIVGIQIIQAPSVYDVLANRFLATTLALNKFMTTAASLPSFSPAAGHSYVPVTTRKQGAPSAVQSRAGSPGPEALSQPTVMKQGAQAPTSQRAVEQSLFDALMSSIRYGTEYMDKNPLNGEPGSFVFKSTNAHIKQQEDAQAKAAETLKAMQESTAMTATQTPKSQIETQILQAKRGIPALDKLRTAGAKPKPSRKKSKAPLSPT